MIVAVCAAGMTAVVSSQYQVLFAGALDDGSLRALAANPGIRVLFGKPTALGDPGGFTVWRTGTAIMVLVGVWASLTATRLTRGDEDTGRADLLLAGRLTLVAITARRFAVLAGCVVAIGIAVTTALIASGTAYTGALVHGCGVVGAGLFFAATGLLAAQVMPVRSTASGAAAGVLVAMLLARMVADGVDQLAWLAWVTPFGLAGQAAPYAGDRVVPLVVVLLVPWLFVAAALLAAGHRDVGTGMLRRARHRRPRTRLLGSATSFAVRRAIGPTVAWSLAIAVYFVVVGALVASITRFLDENPRFADLAAVAGFDGLGTAEGFAAAMFSLASIPVGIFGASRMSAAAEDEVFGRATLLLSLPISRTRQVLTEALISAAAVVVPLAAAAFAFWLGTLASGTPIALGASLAGALNVAPVAWLSLGAATLAYGWSPRAVLAVGAVPTAGGFLLHVIAQSVHAPGWVGAMTPYAHLAPVPVTSPAWAAALATVCVGAALVALGVLGYSRRDTMAY